MKRYVLLALILAWVWPTAGFSQETMRLGLFPFDITSKTELSYLRGEIPKIIAARLSSANIDTVILEAPGKLAVEPLRRAALAERCTHMAWGHISQSQDRFQLTVYLIKTTGDEPAQELSSSVDTIENLLGSIQKVSDELRTILVPKEIISEIRVEGNARIEDEAITRIIASKAGDDYVPQTLSADLKAIYNMGYFDDIRIESADTPKGKVITFHVVEKPTVKSVEFRGNKAINTEKLQENVDIRSGSILNIFNVRKNIQKLELQYQEKNYQAAKISYETKDLGNNQVTLVFVVEEGAKVQIKRIDIEGNTAYKDKKIKGLMKTSEKGFFSWLTSSGEYKEDLIARDMAAIDAFYQNNGYIQIKIGDPVVRTEGGWIYLTIKLEEGPRYKMGNVDVTGDLILGKEDLLKQLKTPKEAYYSRDVVRQDMLALTDIYGNYGYAFAQAEPRIRQNAEAKTVDIAYALKKGDKVYFDKINITGNTKTKDKVLRRELKVQELSLYNGADIKRSVKNLNRLDFFEDVKVETPKGSADNTLDLNLNVKEKPTGQFTIGGGYSSYEHLFLISSVSQNNLFGGGQSLSLSTQMGSETTRFMLKYAEPWTFDIPLVTTYTGYNWERDYDDYTKDSVGASIGASYPFFNEDFRLFSSYGYDVSNVSDIDDDASTSIKELKGENTTSSVTVGATYDTRDKIAVPSSGVNHSLSVQYAGLGGTVGYTKLSAEAGWYIPIFKKLVGFIHGESGYIFDTSNKLLPDYEKYYLGGINSIRGLDYEDICLYDNDGAEVGGIQTVQMNLELLFPIAEKAGLRGVLFFDTGQVYDPDRYFDRTPNSSGGYDVSTPADFDLGQLRKTAGAGIRWYSPMGPIRIEYGFVLDKQKDEDAGQLEFTMGSAF